MSFTKMEKNLKSRIPVPIQKIQKSSKLCNAEESLETRSCLPKKQGFYANKNAKPNFAQKNTERKLGLQFHKTNLKDSIKNADFRNKSASLKTSLKCDKPISNGRTLEKIIKSNDKNKVAACKTNVKPNFINKSIAKTLNKNTSSNNKKTLLSAEIKRKVTSIEDKEENLPSPISCSFEQEVCTPQNKQMVSKQDCFSENKDVAFEANEIYRKMILNNIELSPGVRKLMPGLRLSSLQSERPSIYQKVTISKDPLRDALKALENTCLSAKRIKKEDNLASSPRRETFRDSIYTPMKCDPNEEYLRKLENFKLKQLQKIAPKNSKKVTFNLNTQECTSKNTSDVQHNLLQNSEDRLMQINEKSKENKSNYPQVEKNDEIKLNDISLKHEQSHISNRTSTVDKQWNPTRNYHKDNTYPECKETLVANKSNTTSHSPQRTIEPMTPHKSDTRETTLQILKEISCESFSPDFVCDTKNNENYENCLETNTILPFEQKGIKQSAKVYTPKPISLSCKSKLNQSFSPEFLVNAKSSLVTDLAPICTPLVLKSQARNIMLSPEFDEGPIKLKWDFVEEEKDAPKKETFKTHTVFSLDNIITIQKQSDQLADQECYLTLINEKFPVICGRYLTNPVARILNEGDDMHFIPI